MNDSISRQEALDAISKECRCGATVDQCGLETAYDLLKELPPAEPQWIPCGERLPEEKGEYMTCDERGNIHIFFHSPDFRFPFGIRPANPRYYEPIAWMPLPKPYEGEC